MTRTEAKANLVSIGIENPTDEQITSYLNQVNGATQAERTKADKYKLEADKVADLQKQLDEKNEADMSEVQKATALLEKANNRIAELEKAQAVNNQRTTLMNQMHITAEQAKELIADDGTMNYEVLGRITTEKETAAANAKEQEIAGSQNNPGSGGKGSGDDNKDPDDVANAKSITFATASKDAKSAIDYYTK